MVALMEESPSTLRRAALTFFDRDGEFWQVLFPPLEPELLAEIERVQAEIEAVRRTAAGGSKKPPLPPVQTVSDQFDDENTEQERELVEMVC